MPCQKEFKFQRHNTYDPITTLCNCKCLLAFVSSWQLRKLHNLVTTNTNLLFLLYIVGRLIETRRVQILILHLSVLRVKWTVYTLILELVCRYLELGPFMLDINTLVGTSSSFWGCKNFNGTIDRIVWLVLGVGFY